MFSRQIIDRLLTARITIGPVDDGHCGTTPRPFGRIRSISRTDAGFAGNRNRSRTPATMTGIG
jgi:hypothetical protein